MKSNALSFIRLGDIADFRNGLNFSKESHGKGCPLIGVGDFKDNFSPKWDELEEINPDGVSKFEDYLKEGDLLFVRSNGNKLLVGRSLYINKDIKALYSGFCIRARLITDDISPLFFAYFTKTQFFRDAISFVAGTNINNLNQSILSEVRIPKYTKEKQAIIVNILSSLDEKIELNNRINVELEAMAKTLYDYWFVQFDFLDENEKPYKSSGGKMVYNETLKREIPDCWEAVSVAQLVDIKTGKEDANFATEKGKYHFFTCGEASLRCDNYVFNGQAILLAGNGSFSVKKFEGKFNAYQRTYVLMLRDELLFSPLYFAVSSRITALTSSSRGSIVKFITKGDIEDIYIPLPKDRDLTFSNILSKNMSESSWLYEQNLELIKLRNWLLPMLMNGQVTLKPSNEIQETQHG
ncbi:restriction endonuclease subunit S [Rosenbergiella nectarea]|uniref:restriction endonuclease subunit S n=1 Tax=Rosenbergiella nectarea TaxID=988801 RepID=UPI001F4D5911|nr:restriction endonuclease subunit S [Rosenbergiella nectarea]